jgi:hypothetical protein
MAKARTEKPKTELVVIDQGANVTLPDDEAGELSNGAVNPAAAAFLAAVKGHRETPARMPLITIDHDEGKFVMPSGELVESVGGYPIYYFKTRAFYLKPPRTGEKGQPPDCWSASGIQPSPLSSKKQNDACYDCSRNQFGSAADGRSKACGTHIWIFLLSRAYGDPPVAVLRASASSLKPLEGSAYKPGYFQRAMAKSGGAYELVRTTFALERGGDRHFVLSPIMGEAVTDLAVVAKIVEIRNKLLPAMEEVRGMTPEAVEEHE